MKKVAVKLWRIIRGPMQWRVLWLWHSKFMVGVTGIVRHQDGRVLLLKHRMWPEGQQWGLPTGYANAGESFEDTIVREVREETGLMVKVCELAHLKSGYKLRVEVAYEALYVSGQTSAPSFEILEAQWFSPDELPDGLQESHRQLISRRRR
ncbi:MULTISPECIES: NUDIX domain-containing protein [Streptomycetaceae]|uniref:NUDIX domain-containing protein n=1 Tax=Streptomycetaceae TaxID=2062 RepID=UPI00093F1724|nr:NUDIX domain-containing protein [Streptomyces sp. CB02056]OKI09130.1 NUDIX hydrolase [Streptomyces sp. CB02056]